MISSISRLFSFTISELCVPSWFDILYSNVYLFIRDTLVKYGSARKCRRKFRPKFRDESSQQTNNSHFDEQA